MKVLITKFSGGSVDFGINYFLTGNLVVEDYLIVDDLPLDSFPLFSDEFTRDNNSVTLQGGEYDMVLSLLDDSVRSNNGLTVNKFFQFGYSTTTRIRLRIIIEVDGVQKLVGFIDNTSFDFNYNWKESDSQTLKFTVYSAEVEFINGLETKSYYEFVSQIDGLEGQNFWMWCSHLCSYGHAGFNLSAGLNNNNIGVFNKLSPLHRMFYNETCDKMLIAACKGFGLLFKISAHNVRVEQWNWLTITFFNRKYGLNYGVPAVVIDDTIDHHELRTDIDERLMFYGIPHVKITEGQYTEGDNFKGIVVGKAGPGHIEYVEMRFYPSVTPNSAHRLWLFLLSTGFPFGIWDLTGEKNFTTIDIDMVEKNLPALLIGNSSQAFWEINNNIGSGNINITHLSICRCFVKTYAHFNYSAFGVTRTHYSDDGADLVAKDFVSSVTYMHLINQFQRVKELQIMSEFDFLVLSFDEALFEGQTYTVERVNNINIDDKSYNIQLINNIT